MQHDSIEAAADEHWLASCQAQSTYMYVCMPDEHTADDLSNAYHVNHMYILYCSPNLEHNANIEFGQ